MESTTKPALLFFDDECLICNGFIQFVLEQDKGRGNFHFASLHNATGQQVVESLKETLGDRETMILAENGKNFTQSTALLKVLLRLGGPWQLLHPLIWIPPGIRDWGYQLFSKNRYLFGKKQRVCLLLSPEQQQYFVDSSLA